MKFNAEKCKVLNVAKSEPMFINELPFCKYSYTLGDKILDYTSCERDLGILINTSIAIMMTKVPSHQKIMILIGLE